MKWCRLDENNFVFEVVNDDPTGKYHPDFVFMECPDETEQQDYYTGSEFIKPAPYEAPDNIEPLVEDVEGVCIIRWKWFDGTWEGWGFEAVFNREDITALGLKVYNENNAYLYALTFVESEYPGQWITETPAGFATPNKETRKFEIIAGSAPVSDLEALTVIDEYRSLFVTWQPGDPA